MTCGAYGSSLWLLTALFVVRVLAQPASLFVESGFLPPFESWHGGVVPYPALVITQIAIIVWLGRTAHRIGRGSIVRDARWGRQVFVLGVIYFDVMFTRLVLGMTLLRAYRWVASPLPAFFHLVLASYLMLYGPYHWRGPRVPVTGPLS